jgi:predicted ABC-type ATPase
VPDYRIIAGPNGAGKSTFSAILSSSDALIFDADKVKAVKEKQYPDLPDESIEMMITSAYWEAEDFAVEHKKDLTVETNLRNDFLINRLSFFKGKGYTTHLVYMLLPDVQTSMDRVTLRVAQKGHFIDWGSIKYNFEQGLVMLKKSFDQFDTVTLMASPLGTGLSIPETLLTIKNNSIHFVDANPPLWAKPLIDEIILKLNSN